MTKEALGVHVGEAYARIPADLGRSVLLRVAEAANIEISQIQPGFEITTPPLAIQGDHLRYLATSLAMYMQFYGCTNPLTLPELQTPGLTVVALIRETARRLS